MGCQWVELLVQYKVLRLMLTCFAVRCHGNAATIAYLHIASDASSRATSLVTASIDRVDLLRFPLSSEADLLMSGMVVSMSNFDSEVTH